jgi:hypothetical protein
MNTYVGKGENEGCVHVVFLLKETGEDEGRGEGQETFDRTCGLKTVALLISRYTSFFSSLLLEWESVNCVFQTPLAFFFIRQWNGVRSSWFCFLMVPPAATAA